MEVKNLFVLSAQPNQTFSCKAIECNGKFEEGQKIWKQLSFTLSFHQTKYVLRITSWIIVSLKLGSQWLVDKSGWLTKCKALQWEIKHCLKQTNVTTVQRLGQCIHWSSIGLFSTLQIFWRRFGCLRLLICRRPNIDTLPFSETAAKF